LLIVACSWNRELRMLRHCTIKKARGRTIYRPFSTLSKVSKSIPVVQIKQNIDNREINTQLKRGIRWFGNVVSESEINNAQQVPCLSWPNRLAIFDKPFFIEEEAERYREFNGAMVIHGDIVPFFQFISKLAKKCLLCQEPDGVHTGNVTYNHISVNCCNPGATLSFHTSHETAHQYSNLQEVGCWA